MKKERDVLDTLCMISSGRRVTGLAEQNGLGKTLDFFSVWFNKETSPTEEHRL